MTEGIQGKVPVAVTDETLDEFVTGNTVAVIDCWAVWCFPCRVLTPVMERLAEEHGEIAFGELNVDENMATARRFNIMSIPTLLYFRDGKLVDRTVGALPREAVEGRLGRLLA